MRTTINLDKDSRAAMNVIPRKFTLSAIVRHTLFAMTYSERKWKDYLSEPRNRELREYVRGLVKDRL